VSNTYILGPTKYLWSAGHQFYGGALWHVQLYKVKVQESIVIVFLSVRHQYLVLLHDTCMIKIKSSIWKKKCNWWYVQIKADVQFEKKNLILLASLHQPYQYAWGVTIFFNTNQISIVQLRMQINIVNTISNPVT
jgi:hypothetical protein